MIEGIQLDLGTSAVLALVYVAEGFRRVPAGAVVARRILWSDWSAESESAAVARWRLVSYLPPLTTAIVIPAWSGDNAAGVRDTSTATQPSRSATGWRSVMLTISSALLMTLLILGLPAAAASRGSLGFLIALAMLFLLCAVQAVLVARVQSALSPVSVTGFGFECTVTGFSHRFLHRFHCCDARSRGSRHSGHRAHRKC